MNVIDTNIPDVKIIEPRLFEDSRGYFMETWQQKKFEELVTGKETNFVQDNQSVSSRGVLRGLHYQKANAQGKLVRVTEGEVYDVAVDIRKGSPTFGKWAGAYLSSENKRMLWVPEGFAHGFCVVSEMVSFLYKCTDYYNPEANVTIAWDDKDIGIEWPEFDNFILSDSDSKGKSLKACIEEGILL
ncbi:dTDP-4-dehydrorhamnose 3,5-epimerase [Vibrio vulnificus]|uniref:dTDP-4-dehydrorhamnose 3,5-epimerase n=1 Tax=Vibrio vulnificus TaxID=672 RepID=UPI0040590962